MAKAKYRCGVALSRPIVVRRPAGIGASLQGFVSTLGGALVGAVIGRQFNGTMLPLAAGSLCCGAASLLFVLLAEKGRLFRGHHGTGGAASAYDTQAEGVGLH